MLLNIVIAYLSVRFLGELFLNADVPETDIRKRCRCSLCSGLNILN